MSAEKAKFKRKAVRSCGFCAHKFDESKAQCPSCGQWNIPSAVNDSTDQTILLSDVSEKPINRIVTGPWDRCFGGGIVTVSVTLLGGVPGAGKSTMSLQMADQIGLKTKREVIYIGAEESVEEIKYRAMRLDLKAMNLIRLHPMGSSADLGEIIKSRKPSAVILDSLPGLVSDPDVAVELCKRFKEYSVEYQFPTIIIDHVTKDNDFAGFMQLQQLANKTRPQQLHQFFHTKIACMCIQFCG